MCLWSMLNLQDANSFMMENFIMFHDFAMMLITLINILMLFILLSISQNYLYNKNILHNQILEIIWTIIPMIFLILMAIPSLMILYLSDEIFYSLFTIKVIGHQWYWSYEYSDFNNIMFDSFMINEFKNNNFFRLLEVDNRMIIPFNYMIRILTTSTDVIHSWTIPSMGMKIDSIPGRINQTYFISTRPGIYFGQCSEICGMNHSFMPICLESTSDYYFLKWLKSF